jgi:hypothetical protein
MRNVLFNFAIAFTMTSVFVVLFWSVQIGAAVSATARAKTGTYAVASDQYLPIKLQPVY